MTSQDDPSGGAAQLRRRAEEMSRRKAAQSPEDLETLSSEQVRRTLHELRVHQIELEMQNEELRRAQAELDAARARYFDLYDLAPVGYCTVSEQGLIQEANLTAAGLLGVPRGTLAGQRLTSFICPDDEDLYYRHRKKLFETGEPQVCELRMMKVDRTAFWVRLEATAAEDSGGVSVGRLVISDITKSKQAGEALRESQEQYRRIVETAREGIWVIDTEGKVSYANQRIAEMLGYPQADVVGRPVADFIAQEHHELSRQNLARRRQGIQEQYEFAFLRRTGSPLHAVVSTNPLWDQAGRYAGALGMLTDITERKLAEEALARSRAEMKAIYDYAPVMMCVVDADRHVVYANPAFAAFIGAPDEGLRDGRAGDVFGCINALDDPRGCGYGTNCANCALRLALEDTFETGTGHHSVEHRTTLGSDGDRRGVVLLGSTAHIPATGQKRILLCLVDITERKRAEEALRESEETHRALVEGLPDLVARFDRDGRHLFISENVREVVDFQSGEVIGKTHRELGFPEAQCQPWEEAIRRVFDSGRPFETEFTLEGKHGPDIYNWRLVPERDAQGAVRSVLSIGRDITAHRRAEEDYRTLFREMLDGFALHQIHCDEEGRPTDYRFLAVNPAFERMTGLNAQDILGRTVREVMPGSGRHWTEAYGRAALSGEPAFFENCHAGLKKHFAVTAFRPAPNQFACIFADITERKVLEAQLQQAQKMESIGRLAGGVAHDFNNLLTVINGYSQLLLGRLSAGDPMRANLEEIHKAGERAAGLTRQLLAFSRKQVLEPRVLDLNRVVEDMRPMLRRVVGEDVEVRVELHAKAGMVRADPHQLEQVVMNLVVNARDAMPDGGRLLIETACVERDEGYARSHPEARAGRYVMLAVSDNGAGMDEQTRQRVFEPFFTTKGVGQGTGLGLSMVQGIVAQSGGHVNVYSEPGQGTTFKIYLPALAEAEADAGQPEAVPALGGRETVLVVEDQAEVRNYAAAALKAYGYHVITAENAGEALLLGERDGERIDLLLTDVVMPNVSGRELAARLEKLRPAIKVLFMSGYTDNVIAHHGILEQGAEFLQKPFSPERLARKVRAVLGPPKPLARILVADDEAGVRGFLRKVLERGGYEVTESADGKQALRQARAGHVDLVITDLVMPEQEGIETIQALRKEMPGVRIMAMSGAFGGQYLKTAQLLGAHVVLMKPVNAELLLAKVAEVLKLRG